MIQKTVKLINLLPVSNGAFLFVLCGQVLVAFQAARKLNKKFINVVHM